MTQSQGESFRRSQSDLLRALRLTLWVVPVLMAVLGISFVLFENSRHVGDTGWPWLTLFGLIVLGIVGPVLSWICLRWALGTAVAYLSSQEQLAQRAEELATLNTLSVATGHSLNSDRTITTILEQTMAVMDADAGMIFIQENGPPGLRLEAHRGISVDMARKEAYLAPGHCLCGQAVERRQVLFAGDVGEDPRCISDLCICEGFRSVACAPLEVKGQLLGLMQLASPNLSHFTVEQQDFLAAVASQVSISIENARLYDTVRTFNVELEQKVNRRTSELEAARWALAEKARQLQRLLSKSYQIQEDTQARIAHDMHDGVTQMIIGALYETQAAQEALREDPDRAADSLSHAQRLLAEVDTEIRRAIYDLHPPVLDMMGLTVALKRFAATFEAAFDIECQVLVSGDPRRLAKETEIAIYRIAQAALHNVAAHANANQVLIAFDFGGARLLVSVEDDGIGFDPAGKLATPGDHLGLIGMKERAESLGANLIVNSVPGDGTRVELKLPAPSYLDNRAMPA
ncbi:MAG: GAF domain-containing sensor histidine kinase [Chloroflexota bacterium]|nr:MAG: GAF domain-containing sensor histidine kinase [Chloroflexota bacterium]